MKQKVGLSDRVEISEDILFKELDEEAVILDLSRGIYFGLDPVGRRVWELLVEHNVIGDVIDSLVEEFDVERERAERDVLALVSTLLEKGLVNRGE